LFLIYKCDQEKFTLYTYNLETTDHFASDLLKSIRSLSKHRRDLSLLID